MIMPLFEDNHLLILDKPHGMLTQDDDTHRTSLEALAKAYIKEKYNKPGAVFLHALHRIDRPVSGIVLFAKTSKALSRLNVSLREHKFKKTYLALTEHTPPKTEDTLTHYLLRESEGVKVVKENTPDAKKAILSYKVIGENLLEIDLETGRHHQIRAQLAHIGCPIIGDLRYGSSLSYKEDAIALCHSKLTFPHPITNEEITIASRHSLLE